MQNEHQIIALVSDAKGDIRLADELIRAYIPFIKSETSKFLSRPCTEQDDEFSIAMIAFHEAIQGYSQGRGAFLKYAALTIRSRLIDYQRKEMRHRGNVSLYAENDDDDRPLIENVAGKKDRFEESENLEATQQEIAELSRVMSEFGVGFSDVSENSPRQERTLESCRKVIFYAAENSHLLDDLLRTKRLPLAELVVGSGVDRKTIERHRKYILTMLLIQTNGYEIIRGHLRGVIGMKGGIPT